jgi:hypothetical protein
MDTKFNWCSCQATIVSTNSCKNNGQCVITPHMLIKAADSVFPCGASETTGVIPIMDKVSLKSNSTDIASYTIVKTSVNLINVSIDEDNITFTASYDPLVADSSYTTGQIKYKVQQGAESNLGIIDIVFKTRCSTVSCDAGQVCDPCLGTCVDEVVDISVSSQESNPLIDIQIS